MIPIFEAGVILTGIDEMLQKLNSHQLQAVLDESPAALVNANVGSGKTTVLISKIFYLYSRKGVALNDMVVLTFTNKAAGEIKERITLSDPLLTDADMPYFGTFHSVAMKLLQTVLPLANLGFKPDFTIIDPDELTELAARLAAEKKLEIKYASKMDKRLEAYRAGNKLYGSMRNIDDIDSLWEAVTEEKRRINKLDFNDLIVFASQLCDRTLFSPKWIIIDEFQDSDRQQLELIRKMALEETKLFAVGDPNQIIYGWRGSSLNVFRDFKREYGACEFVLPINYRSSSTILEAASSVLGGGPCLSGIRDQGSKITVRSHYNPFNEAEYLADKIKRLHETGVEYSDIAIFYRTQKQSRSLEDSFGRARIPFEVSVRKTLKDIPVLLWFVQLLKASANINDIGSIVSALSNPDFGDDLTAKEARKIASGKSKKTSELYEKILNFCGWAASAASAEEIYGYYQIDGHLSPTSARFAENKRHIINLIRKFQAYLDHKKASISGGLIEFINSAALYGVDVLKEDIHIPENTVKLMTLHACKGLEFNYVFIIGANYGLIPVISSDDDEREEEKRLFFVGITRAKDNLELSYYTSPDDQRVMPGASSYLDLIPPHLIEGRDGASASEVDLHALRREIAEKRRNMGLVMDDEEDADEKSDAKTIACTDTGNGAEAKAATSEAIVKEPKRVRHEKYGIGTVESEDEETVNVVFEAYGGKSFSKLFNPLEYLT